MFGPQPLQARWVASEGKAPSQVHDFTGLTPTILSWKIAAWGLCLRIGRVTRDQATQHSQLVQSSRRTVHHPVSLPKGDRYCLWPPALPDIFAYSTKCSPVSYVPVPSNPKNTTHVQTVIELAVLISAISRYCQQLYTFRKLSLR